MPSARDPSAGRNGVLAHQVLEAAPAKPPEPGSRIHFLRPRAGAAAVVGIIHDAITG